MMTFISGLFWLIFLGVFTVFFVALAIVEPTPGAAWSWILTTWLSMQTYA